MQKYTKEILAKYKLIKDADYSYYIKDSEIMKDSEYDVLKKEFKQFEIDNNISPEERLSNTFGLVLPKGKRAVKRDAIYKSEGMADAFDMKEAINHIEKLDSNSSLVHVSNKIDGLTGRLFYENGILTQVLTRGDGETGEEVTASFINKVANVEEIMFVKEFVNLDICEVRGEISATWEETKLCGYNSARSFASGTLRSEKVEDNKRVLNFTAFDAITKDILYKTKKDMYLSLEDAGFNVPNYVILDVTQATDMFDLEKIWLSNGIGEEPINHPLDGLVISINDLRDSRNTVFNRFAFKFKENEHLVKILDVINQVGKSGKITPVALTDDWTSSDGACNNLVTCHNYNLWQDAGKGSTIKVIKSAAVIPKIIGVEIPIGKLTAPTQCPCCKSPVVAYKSAHYCSGVLSKTTLCQDALAAKLVDFCSTLEIKGMGIENAKALVKYLSNGGLDNINLWDIIQNRYYFESIIGANGEKLAKQIDLCACTITNEKLLEAMSYDLVGGHVSKLLCERFSLKDDLLSEFFDYQKELSSIDGIGDTIIASFKDDMEFEQESGVLSNMIDFFQPIEKVIEVNENSKIKDWSIVITGKFIGEDGEEIVRGHLGDYLKQFGAVLKTSVSKKTNLLIVGTEPGAVKVADAKKNDVQIMSSEEFLRFVK